MFKGRVASAVDCEIWIMLNREFMAGEIKDDDLWNNTDKVSDKQFEDTFNEALKQDDHFQRMDAWVGIYY